METNWKFYLHVPEAWDAMYADLQKAKHSIDLEQYIFEYSSELGKFFDLLKEKAKSGVRVRLLCDMVGSYQIYESPEARELSEAGIDIQFANPASAWRVDNWTSWFFRDHRKLLIIDDTVGHVGGVGFNANMCKWRDTNMRLEGSVVEQMREAFELMWVEQKTGKHLKLQGPQKFVDGFAFVANTPRFSDKKLYRMLLKAIRHARSCIYITTPYFVPTTAMFRRMSKAARRGVDVRILVPMTSDSLIMDLSANSYFGMSMKAGVRIYRYQNHVLHSKTVVIDDTWATIGSMNMDNQSFKYCYEANVVVKNGDCVKELKNHFLEDLKMSEEINRQEWEKRPWADRILEILTWPLHQFI